MPSYQIKQSSTAYPLVFLLVSSSDHITGVTGITPTVTIRKPGGSFASPSGAVSEIANGWYQVAGNATDSGTLGPLLLHATGTGADPCDVLYEVVAHDVQDAVHLGLSALPTANAGASGGLPLVASQIPNATAGGVGGVPVVGTQIPNANAGANGGLPTVDANNNIHGVQPGTGTGQLNPSGGKVPATIASGDAVDVAPITTGTAQAGGSNTITLAAGASAVDNFYQSRWIRLTGGTGVGQVALITAYNGTAKVATIAKSLWSTMPDVTTTYSILPTGPADVWAFKGTTNPGAVNGVPSVDVGYFGSAAGTFAGGMPAVDLEKILARTLTETVGGNIVAAFKHLFDVATPTLTCAGTDQTGDSFARLGAPAGASVSADIAAVKSDTATLLSRLTAARAGYFDNLNVGGAVASHADIAALNQSASKHLLLQTVPQYQPGETYTIECRTYAASDGSAVNADTTPTLTATGTVSGSLNANLSAATNPSTGVYRWTYTPGASPTLEQIRFDVSATISASTFTLSCYAQTVDEATAVFTATDQAHLTSIFNKLPTNNIADETLLLSAIGSPMQAGTAVQLAATQPNYAPAKDGDAMTLTAAYDAAKTAASQASVTALGSPMQAGTAVALSSAGMDGITIETGINARQAIALIMDAVASLLSGAGPGGGTITIKNPGGSANRIVAVCDGNGNRTSITLTPPA